MFEIQVEMTRAHKYVDNIGDCGDNDIVSGARWEQDQNQTAYYDY